MSKTSTTLDKTFISDKVLNSFPQYLQEYVSAIGLIFEYFRNM